MNKYNFKNRNKYIKPKFDKSTIVPDTDKSCANCIQSKTHSIDKKYGVSYNCELKKYMFFSYWRQTQARNCDSFKSE